MSAPTPDERQEWRALADAATPGPWEHGDDGPDGTFMGCGEVWTMGADVLGGSIAAPSGDLYPRSGYNPRGDMAFIAAARDAVPALLDALDAAEAEVDMLRGSSNPADLAENLRLRAEVERLARWKAEALAVLAEWDGVHEALGSPATLGERKSTASFREAMRLRAEVERRARLRVRRVVRRRRMTACPYCPDLELTDDPWAFYAHLEAIHGPRAIPDTPGVLMDKDQAIDDVSMVLAAAVGFVVGLVGFGWVALQAARRVVQR